MNPQKILSLEDVKSYVKDSTCSISALETKKEAAIKEMCEIDKKLKKLLPVEREEQRTLLKKKDDLSKLTSNYDKLIQFHTNKEEQINYKEIDMSFMESVKQGPKGLKVPRFGIFRVFGSHKETMQENAIRNSLRYKLGFKKYLETHLKGQVQKRRVKYLVGGIIGILLNAAGITCSILFIGPSTIGLLALLTCLCCLFMSAGLGFSRGLLAILDDYSPSEKSTYITTKFQGTIPDTTRDKIQQARKHFSDDELYFVTEVDKWEVSLKPSPSQMNIDPLLVGQKGHKWFLIDKFDITPGEHYVASEFTD